MSVARPYATGHDHFAEIDWLAVRELIGPVHAAVLEEVTRRLVAVVRDAIAAALRRGSR